MPLMSLADYARHRGVSKPAVTYAIRDGRISTTTNHAGKRVIDSEAADVQWEKNSGQQCGGPESIRPRAEKPKELGLAPAPTGPQATFDPRALLLPEKPDPPGASSADGTYAKARADKESFNAKIAEVEYKKMIGELIPSEIIKKEWLSIAASVKSKILGIPSKARQRIGGLTNDQYLTLEALVREALEDLANNKGENDGP